MRRVGAFEQWRGRIEKIPMKAVLIASGVVLLLALGGILGTYVLQPDHFPVLHVRFEGEFKHVGQQQVIDAIGDGVRGNLFRVDLDGLKARVEAIPWVYRASVRRRWPDTIDVSFSEQHFVAQWATGGWLNGDAVLVKLPGPDVPAGLPILDGPDGTQALVLSGYVRFARLLEPTALKIAAVELSPRRTWSLRLDNRFSILLGGEEPDARLARFVREYPDTVAGQIGKIRQVDLRYTNGFSVEWQTAS